MSAPKPPHQPRPSCPWRLDQDARSIPNFSLDKAEALAATCPDARNMGPGPDAAMFACHQSRIGAEVHCAGWLATVGHRHPAVRLSVLRDRLDPGRLEPGADWPALHENYGQVLEKLRATAPEDVQDSGLDGRLPRTVRPLVKDTPASKPPTREPGREGA
ncbi:DUF6283 family protein [Variovorax sp. NFACC27]|uniref:DUF6283 family protein n=1 Tax=unclassified Variovorax TaxID=663243 RepID=UPI00089B0BC4|nr:hypothetical protein [Variovorax paradoxus]SEF35175.1 hypothetical protein SAMN03159371_07452 [Variovorax sp. NFACC28]SEG98761.1 hypothetical protein SAMN03159365_07340 [Variovorax sp. NFACC29]SFE14639.1 hypothetical protein SAMN03159379_07393 [Variovorax sp. NFACC26]SFH19508.1 hypothetical protein SAMN03159447_07160 [Variovorax sp. NFACC27]